MASRVRRAGREVSCGVVFLAIGEEWKSRDRERDLDGACEGAKVREGEARREREVGGARRVCRGREARYRGAERKKTNVDGLLEPVMAWQAALP